MNYKIRKDHHSPAYLQLYEQLKCDIVKGIYPLGSRLPSKRTIAAETGVSVITAEHALELLCDEGYLELRERSGSYVIYRETDFQSEGRTRNDAERTDTEASEKKTGAEVPKRDGENSAKEASKDKGTSGGNFPYSVLARTMRRVLNEYGDKILVKGPNQGCPELRQELVRYLGRSRGMRVSPEQIVIGAGAEYLYGLIAQLMGESSIFALEKPSYEKIRQVYEAMGIVCRELELGREGIPTGALRGTRAGVLHVTPFNSYPSGITVGISKKKEYLKWARENHAYIVEDNYDSELTVSRKSEESLFAMSENDDVIYINTFSRTIAPSMRIGYLILPKGLMGKFQEKLGFYSCTVPLFEQYVLAELVRSGNYERNINRIRRKRRKEKG